MKNNTIYLEAIREENQEYLKIALYQPNQVLCHYEVIPVPISRIESLCREMTESLNSSVRKGIRSQQIKELRQFGKQLGNELLTRGIRERLRKTRAEYLILKLDDHLVHLPWELLCVDERNFLCQQFDMGRLVKTRQAISENNERNLSRPLKMWILADLKADLPFAYQEGKGIYEQMIQLNQKHDAAIIAPELVPEIESDEIRENLKDYDFIHVTGHVDYDLYDPCKSGWRLSEGNFTVNDIDAMTPGMPMPALIFSNACQSARTEEWNLPIPNGGNGSFGLANAFLRAGVRHYVGTFWEIMDETSRYFAEEFYTHLCAGKPIGKVIREVRRDLEAKQGTDICWLSYVLYGDPRTRYFRNHTKENRPGVFMQKHEHENKQNRKSEPTIQKYPMTRSLFDYALNPTKFNEIRNWLMLYLAFIILVLTGITVYYINHKIHMEQQQYQSEIKQQEREKEAHLSKIQQILLERADQKQRKIQQMFEEIRSISPPSEKQISNPLILSVIFSSQTIQPTEKEKFILRTVQNQIEQKTDFTLLEREALDKILPELIQKIRFTPPEERRPSKLLFPKFALILEIQDYSYENTDGATVVYMRLVDVETTRRIEGWFETLRDDMPVTEQKEVLGKTLLERLKTILSLGGAM